MEPASQSADPLVLSICDAHGNDPAALIEILHDISAQKGAIPVPDLKWIAEALNLSRAEIHGTMSFYPDFHHALKEGQLVKVCRGEACQAMGATALEAGLTSEIANGTGVVVEPVYCLGNCALAPAAMVGEKLIGRAGVAKVVARVKEALAGADK